MSNQADGFTQKDQQDAVTNHGSSQNDREEPPSSSPLSTSTTKLEHFEQVITKQFLCRDGKVPDALRHLVWHSRLQWTNRIPPPEGPMTFEFCWQQCNSNEDCVAFDYRAYNPRMENRNYAYDKQVKYIVHPECRLFSRKMFGKYKERQMIGRLCAEEEKKNVAEKYRRRFCKMLPGDANKLCPLSSSLMDKMLTPVETCPQ